MHTKKLFFIPVVLLFAFLGYEALRYFGFFTQTPEAMVFRDNSFQPAPSVETTEDQAVDIRYETIAENLEVPWSIVFTSASRILVTERPGRVRVITNSMLDPEPLLTLNDVQSGGEEGLMAMVLDPNYNENKKVYLCYAYQTQEGFKDRVIRVRDDGDALVPEQVVIENIPAATFHAGCQLGFGPDSKLYISTGDAGKKELAQDLSSLAGKILRINADGSIPDDNPFANSPVWSYGHRNPQGLAWHPVNQLLYSSEHGPSIFDGPAGGDEVNLIQKGLNYGWPEVHHQETQAGMIDPLLVFTPAIAPGVATFYTADVLPQFKNNLMVGMLKGEGILQVKFSENEPSKVESYQQIKPGFGRIRAVAEGPDGYLYFTTSNQDGRGNLQDGDDKLVRIVPAE